MDYSIRRTKKGYKITFREKKEKWYAESKNVLGDEAWFQWGARQELLCKSIPITKSVHKLVLEGEL